MITVLSGGVGAARMLAALGEVVNPGSLTAIVNVGDDEVISGLSISPDLDTITYTLAGAIDTERGWGLKDETWTAVEHTRLYAESSGSNVGWFGLGDRDIGTHMFRTARLSQGAPLSTVTAEITTRWGLEQTLLPATDETVSTRLTTELGQLTFQEYFVREAHSIAVSGITFEGSDEAQPGPGVIEAIQSAEVIVIAPSNPLISIDPILSIPGIREALQARRSNVVAVSPIIGGKALKGPADRLLAEFGHRSDAVGIADYYSDIAASIVIDTVDAELAPEVSTVGLTPIVSPTIMSQPGVNKLLAEAVLNGGDNR